MALDGWVPLTKRNVGMGGIFIGFIHLLIIELDAEPYIIDAKFDVGDHELLITFAYRAPKFDPLTDLLKIHLPEEYDGGGGSRQIRNHLKDINYDYIDGTNVTTCRIKFVGEPVNITSEVFSTNIIKPHKDMIDILVRYSRFKDSVLGRDVARESDRDDLVAEILTNIVFNTFIKENSRQFKVIKEDKIMLWMGKNRYKLIGHISTSEFEDIAEHVLANGIGRIIEIDCTETTSKLSTVVARLWSIVENKYNVKFVITW